MDLKPCFLQDSSMGSHQALMMKAIFEFLYPQMVFIGCSGAQNENAWSHKESWGLQLQIHRERLKAANTWGWK